VPALGFEDFTPFAPRRVRSMHALGKSLITNPPTTETGGDTTGFPILLIGDQASGTAGHDDRLPGAGNQIADASHGDDSLAVVPGRFIMTALQT